MTRTMPKAPSPQFMSYEMFSASLTSDIQSFFIQTKSSKLTRNDIKSPKSRPRPTYSNMIDEAIIEGYKIYKGTSLAAIKKYLEQKYNVDRKASAKRICRCIRQSVSSGHLKQLSGRGASGSFSLAPVSQKILEVKKEKLVQIKKPQKAKSFVNNLKPALVNNRITHPHVTRMSVR